MFERFWRGDRGALGAQAPGSVSRSRGASSRPTAAGSGPSTAPGGGARVSFTLPGTASTP